MASYFVMSSRPSEHFHGLQSLAYKAFFEEVLCKTTPDSVNLVRDIIDQQYAGTLKRAVRERCVKDLYKIMLYKQPPPSVDIFVVMDCILDEHFKSLKVCVPFPAFKSFSDLMAIITHRCPNLKKELEVQFQKMEKAFNNNELYAIPLGSRLLCLKRLFMNFKHCPYIQISEARHSVMSIVGKLFPVLVKLVVRGVFTNKMDVVALIVNVDMADILSANHSHRWCQDSVLIGLRIKSQQFLNPLCSTLKELIFISEDNLKFYLQSVFAFALRHLPVLENLDVEKLRTSEVVNILHQAGSVDKKHYKNAWREAASQLGLDDASPATFSSDGKVSLKRLAHVPINDLRSLSAVSEMCPSLLQVEFVEDYKVSILSFPSQSEKILKIWSNKIETMDLVLRNLKFMKLALEVFGPNLKKLVLNVNCDIDMECLASTCVNLENFIFRSKSRIIMDPKAASRWTPETFLPKLTHLSWNSRIGSCLGVWGALIEKKSTLIHLSLQCCHIGTNAHHNPRLEWNQLPQLWPQLESLEIEHCPGLTMTTLAEIIPQFAKLNHIVLPSSLVLSEDCTAFKRKMMEEESVEIGYYPSFRRSECLFHHV